MARQSNADTAHDNYHLFDLWRKGKTLEQLVPYLSRRKKDNVIQHKLNRRRINEELRIGSAINSQPRICKGLEDLEDQLLEAGLRDPDVPVSAESHTGDEIAPSTSLPPIQGGLTSAERKRLNDLEEAYAYVREELKRKDAELKRYGLMHQFLTDTLRFPR